MLLFALAMSVNREMKFMRMMKMCRGSSRRSSIGIVVGSVTLLIGAGRSLPYWRIAV